MFSLESLWIWVKNLVWWVYGRKPDKKFGSKQNFGPPKIKIQKHFGFKFFFSPITFESNKILGKKVQGEID